MWSISRRSIEMHRVRHREPRLAGAGRAGGEHQRVALQRPQVGVLHRRARAHRALAELDLLEAAARGSAGAVGLEQRSLRHHLADRAFDVAGADFMTAAQLLIQRSEHEPGLLAGDLFALQRHVIAAMVGHHVEAAFDQREILAIASEQGAREPVVVEGDVDPRRAVPVLGGNRVARIRVPHHAPPAASSACSCAFARGAVASSPNRLLGPASDDTHRRDRSDMARGCTDLHRL